MLIALSTVVWGWHAPTATAQDSQDPSPDVARAAELLSQHRDGNQAAYQELRKLLYETREPGLRDMAAVCRPLMELEVFNYIDISDAILAFYTAFYESLIETSSPDVEAEPNAHAARPALAPIRGRSAYGAKIEPQSSVKCPFRVESGRRYVLEVVASQFLYEPRSAPPLRVQIMERERKGGIDEIVVDRDPDMPDLYRSVFITKESGVVDVVLTSREWDVPCYATIRLWTEAEESDAPPGGADSLLIERLGDVIAAYHDRGEDWKLRSAICRQELRLLPKFTDEFALDLPRGKYLVCASIGSRASGESRPHDMRLELELLDGGGRLSQADELAPIFDCTLLVDDAMSLSVTNNESFPLVLTVYLFEVASP